MRFRNIVFYSSDQSYFLPLFCLWRHNKLYSINIGFLFLKIFNIKSMLYGFYVNLSLYEVGNVLINGVCVTY